MNESLKIRVAGNKAQVEELTEKLRDWSKQWGKKKIFRVKRYDRKTGSSTGDPWKYHQSFGARRFVNYITMKLPEDPQKIPEKMYRRGIDYPFFNRDNVKMHLAMSKKEVSQWFSEEELQKFRRQSE